jgi:hypothetical protein
MSGDGKRGVGHRPQATAPILDSTKAASIWPPAWVRLLGSTGRAYTRRETVGAAESDPILPSRGHKDAT